MAALKERLARFVTPAIQDDHWLVVVFIAMLLVTAILLARP
jgi:hypothetical protein